MDRSEFTSRVLDCERKMYRTAYCLLRNSADCQDAVQETIFKAWSKLEHLRDESAFDAWMMQILVNTCRTTLRLRKRRGECELEDVYPTPESSDGALFAAVNQLEDKYRLPVILRYVNGYSAQETAKILHMPYRSVLKNLRGAREILKNEIREGRA